jgi:[acyl-carrier-protein] S-malonyltransferase
MKGMAFIFPGQGSQSIGMGSDLMKNFPEARQVFEEASDAVCLDLISLCTNGPVEELNRTEMTQPALLTASLAAFRVLYNETGWQPDFVAGHSLGEYSAVTAAEGFALSGAVSLVRQRGTFMQEAVPEGEGAMAAVLGMEATELDEICAAAKGIVVPANLNCPGQVVVSGDREAVEDLLRLAKERGAKRSVLLPVSVPSHSPLMAPASEKLKEVLDEISMRDLVVPLVNNADAAEVRAVDLVRDGLVRQLTSPLRWEESIRKMISKGVEVFIEMGPGRVLCNLIRRIDRNVQSFPLENTEGLKHILKIPATREV